MMGLPCRYYRMEVLQGHTARVGWHVAAQVLSGLLQMLRRAFKQGGQVTKKAPIHSFIHSFKDTHTLIKCQTLGGTGDNSNQRRWGLGQKLVGKGISEDMTIVQARTSILRMLKPGFYSNFRT